jgi:hypothetical protein
MGQIADRLKRQRGGPVESGHQGDKGFRERLNAAAEAKKALLEKFRAQAGPDDPAVVERQAAREAVSVAREVRVVERTAARAADAAQRDADAVREAAEQASRDAEHKAARDATAAALKAEQKAARDARYAARKKR